MSGRSHPHEFLSPWPEGSPDWYPPSPASYALRFLGRDFSLHDAPWGHGFGPASQGGAGPLGKDHTGSHGCVNLPYPAARFLYAWAAEGTPVRVVGAGVAPIPPPGVASPPADPTPGPPAGGRPPDRPGAASGYTVRPGDTVDGLAGRLGVSAAALVRANGLRDADHLRAGQTLRLP